MLEDPLVVAHCFDHRQSILRIVDHGLFDVEILAGLAGIDGDWRVPVVRRGDDHRVDVVVPKHLAVIRIFLRIAAGEFGRSVPADIIDVAHGRNIDVRRFLYLADQVAAAAAGADHSDTWPVIGSQYAVIRGRRCQGGALQEISA